MLEYGQLKRRSVRQTVKLVETQEFISQIEHINVWQKKDERAPHKPLLLIFALASVLNSKSRLIPYGEIQEKLKNLLIEFGPQRKIHHPELPFWRLQNDGNFWEVTASEEILAIHKSKSLNTNVSSKTLLTTNSEGGFSEPVFQFLKQNPSEVNRLVSQLLENHFPTTMHESILDAVSMPWIQTGKRTRKRSADFRESILRVYSYKCAICGFDGRLGHSDLGLEAAHIKWFMAGGPDSENNGLALCVLHHKLFDRGAIGISEDSVIMVSEQVHGGRSVQEYLIDFAGKRLSSPISTNYTPDAEYVQWHFKEVFRKPSRTVA